MTKCPNCLGESNAMTDKHWVKTFGHCELCDFARLKRKEITEEDFKKRLYYILDQKYQTN